MGNDDLQRRSKGTFWQTKVVAFQRMPIPFKKKADEQILFTEICIVGQMVHVDFLRRFQLLIHNHRCFTRSNH